MREKYESLAATVLKDLAKARGIKVSAAMRKSDVVEAMLAKDAEEKLAAGGESKVMEENEVENVAKPERAPKPIHDPNDYELADDKKSLDSGVEARGILEVLADGYGFIRSENFLPGENDVYVAPSQIRRFGLKTGDIIVGNTRVRNANDKFGALLFVKTINGLSPAEAAKRPNFEDLTPVFPEEKLVLERPGCSAFSHARRYTDS